MQQAIIQKPVLFETLKIPRVLRTTKHDKKNEGLDITRDRKIEIHSIENPHFILNCEKLRATPARDWITNVLYEDRFNLDFIFHGVIISQIRGVTNVTFMEAERQRRNERRHYNLHLHFKDGNHKVYLVFIQ